MLGDHVEQKGSLVTPDSLRFDFSHFQKVTDEQLRQVEHLVNAKIRANIPLKEYRNIPIEEAKELGAIALFGEKYGDHVPSPSSVRSTATTSASSSSARPSSSVVVRT